MALIAAGMLVLTLSMGVGALVLIWASLQAGAAVDSTGAQVLGELTLGAGYALVGWLIASRRSENPLGWVYLGIGLSQVGEAFITLASSYGLVTAPGSIPGADVLAWVATFAWAPGFGLLLSFSLLLFPTGRLPSSRWRPVAAVAVVAIALLGLPQAVIGWSLRGVRLIDGSSSPPDWANAVQLVGLVAILGVAIASIASIVVRFRRSTGSERQQLKWFTWATVPVIGFVAASGFVTYPPVVWILGAVLITPLLPAAIGIAILRYRLYEIDSVISRTVAYAVVTLILGTVYLAALLTLESALAPFTSGAAIPVAASTLAVYALFQPVMRRVRRAVDRRFDRVRYDAEQTAVSFSGRLRDEVDLDAVIADLTLTTEVSLAPSSAAVWIRLIR